MEIGHIKPKRITEEMEESYLDYAMSVIVARALPDLRDGLKPVHRRILYSMYGLGLNSKAKFRKSATVVGECLGKFHPHGDIAVYDSMARLVQDFSLRYPLINGQGNWGSIDGDAPAAMRYTEAKLTPIAEEMLVDINKETVDFVDNYDRSRKEPVVLPAKIPQLLLNGTMGIAVGMATNIPPHNLSEVIDGIICLIDCPEATIEKLMEFIKGPDFPTGGMIYNTREITQAYATGHGKILMRGKAQVEEIEAGRFQIIISEIPYQVNKASLVETIANLVREKKIEGIKNIRDESDKDGVRIVIILKNDAQPKRILNKLYKLTDLQKVFHLNMLALVDGIQPKVLTLKMILEEYIKHRQEVVRRRSRFLLRLATERAHILKGLKKALEHIDAVIKTIKSSQTKETAQANLVAKFKLSQIQAAAILEIKLQHLTRLEKKKIEEELTEKFNQIKELKAILKSPQKILSVIKKELLEIKRNYQDERRTQVFKNPVEKFSEEDLIPDKETVISLTKGGYIKRISPSAFRAQERGGRGVIGAAVGEEDTVEHFFVTNTHSNILFFTDKGRVFQIKAYEISETSRVSKGQNIVGLLQISTEEKITAVINLPKVEIKENLSIQGEHLEFFVMATKNGIIKRTKISDFASVRRSGLIAIKLQKNDELRWVKTSSGKDEIILVTSQGQAIRFKEKDARAIGRSAAGVRAINLKTGDYVVGMDTIKKSKIKNQKSKLLIITENGYGKKSDLKLYKVQKRGGSGLKTANVTNKTGRLVDGMVIEDEEIQRDLIIISQKGQVIRITIESIPSLGRATQGVRIMRLRQGDKVASVSCL